MKKINFTTFFTLPFTKFFTLQEVMNLTDKIFILDNKEKKGNEKD